MPKHNKARRKNRQWAAPADYVPETRTRHAPEHIIPAYEHHAGPASAIFLNLTKHTVPGGHEHTRFGTYLQQRGWTTDQNGNGHLSVPRPDGNPNVTGFCAHMDDVSSRPQPLTHVLKEDKGQVWVTAKERSVLGADDKAGMAVLLRMIDQNVPGEYFLFTEEESGMIGSRAAVKAGWGETLKHMVAFDRRGTGSVITYQRGRRCASEAFAAALCSALQRHQLKYRPDPTGSFTDSAAFMDVIPECTNLSVGYEGAHGVGETQNLTHLDALADACCQINWQELPAERDPKRQETNWGTRTARTSETLGRPQSTVDPADKYERAQRALDHTTTLHITGKKQARLLCKLLLEGKCYSSLHKWLLKSDADTPRPEPLKQLTNPAEFTKLSREGKLALEQHLAEHTAALGRMLNERLHELAQQRGTFISPSATRAHAAVSHLRHDNPQLNIQTVDPTSLRMAYIAIHKSGGTHVHA